MLPPEVEVIDGGTCGMEMLEQLETSTGLIVVDCVRANQPPATPILLKGDDVPVFFKTKLSPHQVSLSDVPPVWNSPTGRRRLSPSSACSRCR